MLRCYESYHKLDTVQVSLNARSRQVMQVYVMLAAASEDTVAE